MIVDAIKWALRLSARRTDARFLRKAIGDVDAVLASYPKSGRTWLRFALSCYFARTARLDAMPDLTTTFRILPNLDRDPVRGLPAYAFAGDPALPLIAVSHRAYEPAVFRDRPIIFMVRDPRDVIVSAYFHATRHKRRYEGTLKAFIGDPDQGLAALVGYLNGWATGLARHRHHLVSYEAMSADPATAIRGILGFLGIPCDEAALAEAIAASSFSAMRETELQVGIPGHDYDRNDSESRRMRQGKVGGYRAYLDETDVSLIEERCAAELNEAARALVTATSLDLAPRSSAGTHPAPLEFAVGSAGGR